MLFRSNVSKLVSDINWPSPENGSTILNGVEYSEHALARMAPKGNKFVQKSGDVIEGRGIPPSVVENAIKNGSKTPSYDNAVLHAYQNVKVVTNQSFDKVRSVITISVKKK